jgi:hypothetical protein
MRGAILATGAAMCSLGVCLPASREHVLITMFFFLGSMAMVACAIAQWVIYFREWVRFEIESHEERTKTKQ